MLFRSKNRIINKQLESKSVPALELHAVSLGMETAIEIYLELTSLDSVVPVKINELHLLSDGMVALGSINKYVNKLDKMQKCSIFVKNRLESICKSCSIKPVTFQFISGLENPTDLITRPVSFKQLIKSNYHVGPEFLQNKQNFAEEGDICFQVPNLLAKTTSVSNLNIETIIAIPDTMKDIKKLIPFEKYTSFMKLIRVHKNVMKYVWLLKSKIDKYNINREQVLNLCSFTKISTEILREEQKAHFQT